MEGLSSFILSQRLSAGRLLQTTDSNVHSWLLNVTEVNKSMKVRFQNQAPILCIYYSLIKNTYPIKNSMHPPQCPTDVSNNKRINNDITISRGLWISVLQIIINKKEYAFILNAITYHLISMYHTFMLSMQYQNITQTTCSVLD